MEINSVKQAMQQHAAQMEVLKKQNALLAEQNAEFMEKASRGAPPRPFPAACVELRLAPQLP